jgi:hypothetical protein
MSLMAPTCASAEIYDQAHEGYLFRCLNQAALAQAFGKQRAIGGYSCIRHGVQRAAREGRKILAQIRAGAAVDRVDIEEAGPMLQLQGVVAARPDRIHTAHEERCL